MAPRIDPRPRPETPLLRGGQGRSADDMAEAAAAVIVSAIGAAVVIFVCVAPQIALCVGVTIVGAIGLIVARRGR